MRCGRIIILFLSFMTLFVATACGSAGPSVVMEPISPPPPPRPVVGEPDFDIQGFGVMIGATTSPVLPWLMTRSASEPDFSCFEENTASNTWASDNPMIKANVAHHADRIQTTILDWLIETVLRGQEKAESMRTLQITLDDMSVKHAAQDSLLLKVPATCISDDTRMLPDGARIITTAFGAKTLVFRSEVALDKTLLNAVKSFAKRGRYTYRATPTYPKALDDDGRPLRKKNAWLHVAPDGTIVTAREVPPPARRPVHEFTLTFDGALYFADGDMPLTYWSRETRLGVCSLHLIFDDIVPRIPDCIELNDAGFGVARASDPGSVVVKISAGGRLHQETVPWNKTSRIEGGGRVVAWVTPRSMEEGAILEIDSVVLNPTATPVNDLKPFSFKQ